MSAVDLIPETSSLDLDETANVLASGFQALLAEVESLAHRERYLRRRLDFAYDEVCRFQCFSSTLLA
jgi:hypothetical protein